MSDPILEHQGLEWPVAKMSALVTDDGLGHPEPREDMLFDELDHDFVIIGSSRDRLNPFGHVVHSQKDIEVTVRRREWTHEIDAPTVKDFDHKNWGQGHHVSTGHGTQQLATVTRPAKAKGILKQ